MFVEHPLAEVARRGARLTVCGRGINDATYATNYIDAAGKLHRCPYYRKWKSMLSRVYSHSSAVSGPTYTDCTVEPAWLSFTAFRAWMCTQDWQGKELDKDLLVQGNKHYGPTTCLFISRALNHLLCLRGNARGLYPLGVKLDVRNNRVRYYARCNFYGNSRFLGRFDTVDEAALAYKTAKLAYIAELAAQQTDQRIKQALLRLF